MSHYSGREVNLSDDPDRRAASAERGRRNGVSHEIIRLVTTGRQISDSLVGRIKFELNVCTILTPGHGRPRPLTDDLLAVEDVQIDSHFVLSIIGIAEPLWIE